MNKTAIKNFAVWARNKLIADITYRAGLLGIAVDGMKNALPQSTKDTEFYDIGTKEPYSITGEAVRQRRRLAELIDQKTKSSDYKIAYHSVLEEVAYTWFNRLIAIRFMEVNDYLPSRIRVLSSESKGKLEPDLVTTPFDAELELTAAEQETIMRLKTDNQVDDLFRLLFIKQCNALNRVLPKLFEKTADYTELLLNVSVTDQDGVVYHLVHDIDEDDFNIEKGGQVEIIGWLYQYYNTEPKDEAFALLKKNVKITKERIPAATQLFTPDWIVRYMVENSLGRLWLEGHPNADLKAGWKYYLDEAEQETEVETQLAKIREEYKAIQPTDIKVIDPCMGSGHILVYAFDVLMQIYEAAGYTQREAAKSILENNLYGLDIDDRAFQLAYFAVMMKARQYNRRILNGETACHVYAIKESNDIDRAYQYEMGNFLLSKEHQDTLNYLLEAFKDAKEYGSILKLEDRDYIGLMQAWNYAASQTAENFNLLLWYSVVEDKVPELIMQAIILSQKYHSVITNPPYMGVSNGNSDLGNYVKKYYPNSKTDLFAVFIERCGNMMDDNGYQAMITMQSWMFLKSYEKMRIHLLHTNEIISLLYLGIKAFEEIGNDVVQTAAYIIRNTKCEQYKGTYFKLLTHDRHQKIDDYLNRNNMDICSQLSLFKIPGAPVAFWVSEAFRDSFAEKPLDAYADIRSGMSTTDNERFLRLWFEPSKININFGCNSLEEAKDSSKRWYPYNKGGDYRKWYGNNSLVVNWLNDGQEIKEWVVSNPKDPKTTSWSRRIFGTDCFFKSGITWSSIASSQFGCRCYGKGFIFDSGANGLFAFNKTQEYYIAGLLNSKVAKKVLDVINPSINFGPGTIGKIPAIIQADKIDYITSLVAKCIDLAKIDWDSFETSWDFYRHPLISSNPHIEDNFEFWDKACKGRYSQLRESEEKINTFFIETYGLTGEIDPLCADKEISVKKADLSRDIRSLISYAVGCMFGRYSLDVDGLAYAGGEWDSGKYSSFIPDKDNILPITDEEYFPDDIVGLFCAWLKKVYGEDTLETNLDFIAKALGNKGNTSREIIRNYFLNDFFKDHCQTYSVTGSGKRPIYWLFDSGKQNGFKALVYMHRYDENTIGNLRIDYLHRMERVYDSEIARMQDIVDNSKVAREVTQATKRREKLQKQLKECKEYDERIAHLALARTPIDLDDGVKVNYEKVQTVDGVKYPVLAKI